MDLYLMQHGEALPAEQDEARPLAEEGRTSVGLTARRAARAGVRIERIVHSGKLRAEQSAKILAHALEAPVVERRDGLAPNDSVGAAAEWIRLLAAAAPLGIVSHLPFLDRLTGLLVTGDEHNQVVAFRNGGLVHLTSEGPGAGTAGAWRTLWIITPDVA